MSAFNTKQHSQPKGMRMDKANGELEKVAEVGGSGGQSDPNLGAPQPSDSGRAIEYRGIFVSSRIHRHFDEEIWKAAVDHTLKHCPLEWIIAMTQLLLQTCRLLERSRLDVNKDNYEALFRDARDRGVVWKTHLHAALLESRKLGLTLNDYIESLGLSNPNHTAKPSVDQAEIIPA